MTREELATFLPDFTDVKLIDSILEKGRVMKMSPGKVLIEPGTAIKMVPVVLEGSVKLLRIDEEGNELFLYYLGAGETCALSLTCCASSHPSGIRAVVEEDVTLIAVPATAHQQFFDEFRQWKNFVSGTYQARFQELLAVLDAVAFKGMDERLAGFITTKMKQLKSNELYMTHQEIANELGTSREVISRLLKQIEKKKWIELGRNVIYIRDDFEELARR